MNEHAPEPFVDIESAATFLGVKVSYLYEECRLGRIPSYKLGKFRRFRLTELETWAAARREDGRPDPLGARQVVADEPRENRGLTAVR
jgi:excisionase family DNA binding protein